MSISELPKEMLYVVFGFVPMKDNVKNTQVCKYWLTVAADIAKQQLFEERKQDIESKATYFLKMLAQGNRMKIFLYTHSHTKQL